MAKLNPRLARQRRHVRARAGVTGDASKARLSVFRSLNHVYAQVIDDAKGNTLAAASSLEKQVPGDQGKIEQAKAVGKLVAQRAQEKGIKQVVFDRGGFRYHGRVKALADAAREAGLKL